MYVLGNYGSAVLRANEEFVKTHRNLRNPFWRKHEIEVGPTEDLPNGGIRFEFPRCYTEEEIIELRSLEKEIKEYDKIKNEWMAKYIAENATWEIYTEFCRNQGLTIAAKPCECPDGQCSMECEVFGRCGY